MNCVYHITKREQWEEAQSTGAYRGDTLDTEGFIHCSEMHQVVPTANALFRGQKDLVLLVIDSARVHAEIRYEGAAGEELFPHIYGPLNPDAVTQVLNFEPHPDGSFQLPADCADDAHHQP